MLSCRRATQLISLGLDRPLTFGERCSLRLHLLICSACRCYRRHLATMRGEMDETSSPLEEVGLPDVHLDGAARDRIRARLDRDARPRS
ncbi:MAG: zf-HC2 domain-containing protein [Phycisphaerales bacterium]|nr:zf-HC2 domain-containing protein [Phycisphaerales bacterium]